MPIAESKVDLGAELMTPEAVQNPHDIYDRMRAESPVYWSEAQNAWLVTGYHETQAVLAAQDDFMSGETRGRNVFKLTPDERAQCPMLDRVATTPALSFADQPLHTFHRSLVSRPLAPMQVRGQKNWVIERCDQLVDAMRSKAEPDVVADLAQPISLSLVVRMFGAAPEEEPFYLELAERNRQFFGTFDPDWDMVVRTESVLASFADHIDELALQKRAAPDDSFLSGLLAGAPDGRSLPPEELYVMSLIFLGAAFQTTIAGISATLLGLIRSGQDELVRADPRRAQAAFNEALRWEAPAHRLARRARRDVEVAGQQIHAGDFVWTYLGAANRDPAIFSDPDRYDMTREPLPHFGFGNGVHFCAGAGLAQLEGVTAITALLDRFPDLRISDDWVPVWNDREYPSARSLTSLRVEPGRAREVTRTIDTEVLPPARGGARTLTDLHVTRVESVADGIKTIDLIDVSGAPLPAWSAGAHIAVQLPDGGERQFSLCGDPDDRSTWRFAVLHEPDGRGGSSWIHEVVHPGQFLPIREPLNNFELVDAPSYAFVAGGIGITPLLPMIREVERRGKPWTLHYGGRRRSSLAFLPELGAYGDRVTVHAAEESGRMDVPELLRALSPGTAIYCCGPEGMIDAVEQHHRPDTTVHVERFKPREQHFGPDRPFEVVGDASGVSVTVQPGQSIVDALETVGVYIPTSCGEGTCGTCETGVLDGMPEHHDSVLTDAERLTNRTLMPCCSRAAEGCVRLVLDL